MEDFKNLVIFEMANNHQGSLDHALNIIDVYSKIVKDNNINAAIKLQFRNISTFISKIQLKEKTNKHIDRFLDTELTQKQFSIICKKIKDSGMKLIITPFDEVSVDNALKQNVDIIKIASCSADDWPLIEKIAKTKKSVIASTGGQDIKAIDKIQRFLEHREINFALMHCVSLYPALPKEANVGFIKRLKSRYPNTIIGYSGHEAPSDLMTIVCAIGCGAVLFERHIGLPTNQITLNKYSTDPEETKKWIDVIKNAQSICMGETDKNMTKTELTSIQELARGTFCKINIKKGQKINDKDVYFAFPLENQQLSSGKFLAGIIAEKDYLKDDAITQKVETKQANIIREHVHSYKGMFEEASIAVGKYESMELSHHYGLENLAETGVILITIINDIYCKKLVGLLKGQKHPTHRHYKKDETFHVLQGKVIVVRNDVKHILNKGDKIDIRAGDWHSFESKEGAIFEEVSTTSIVGDSEYKDIKINNLDPYERKSQIYKW